LRQPNRLGALLPFDSGENAINPNAGILKISKQISDRYPFTISADQTEIHFTLNQITMTAIDIVNITRRSNHSLPLGLTEKAIERLLTRQPEFLGRIRDISSSLKDSAKWIKDGGKTLGLPFLAFIAVSTGPIVGVATAKEDAIEDLVDHYARCLDRCRRGTDVSAQGMMDIQDLSPKFDAVAHLFGLNDEIRGFATYYFHALSVRRK